ncbi:MAG: VCBS repeat-containing protein [Cytophagaceae bacterium]|nr:MAG: VCBS repeat-containing protein [Cytophagaceae bacterium]
MNRKKRAWRWLLWLGAVLVGVPALLFVGAVGTVLYQRQHPAAPKELAPLPPPVAAPDSVLGPLHTPALGAAKRLLPHIPPNALAVAPGVELYVPFGRPPTPAELAGIHVMSGQCQLRRPMQAAAAGNAAQLALPSGHFGAGEVVTVSGPGFGNRVQQFTVHAGVGGHAFGGQQAVPVRSQPGFLHVGDVDGDGDPDLLTASVDDHTISVRLNDGHGVYSGDEGLVFGLEGISGLAVGDVDGDGYPDLVTWGGKATVARIWHNDGTGHFTQVWGVEMGGDDTSASLGDVDGKQ